MSLSIVNANYNDCLWVRSLWPSIFISLNFISVISVQKNTRTFREVMQNIFPPKCLVRTRLYTPLQKSVSNRIKQDRTSRRTSSSEVARSLESCLLRGSKKCSSEGDKPSLQGEFFRVSLRHLNFRTALVHSNQM